MADVFEQNLPSKANLTVNDYIRVVGSDNNSYKQLVNDVAKKIIENYTGSSLAGSSQSVKSALDSLNSNCLSIMRNGTALASGTDLNALARGVYYSPSATITGTLLNCPFVGGAFRLITLDSGYSGENLTMQIILSGAAQFNVAMWFRKKTTTTGWYPWYKVTGTEV